MNPMPLLSLEQSLTSCSFVPGNLALRSILSVLQYIKSCPPNISCINPEQNKLPKPEEI